MANENKDMTIRGDFVLTLCDTMDLWMENARTEGEKRLIYLMAQTLHDNMEFPEE